MQDKVFTTDVSHHIWDTKYRYRNGSVIHDHSIKDTWRRIAKALARQEPVDRDAWEQRFYQTLDGFRFLPGGRIHAGAGTEHEVTLFNCFVMGTIEDSINGIFDALKEGALTMHQGGGVGYDFSTLRPKGTRAKTVGNIASGPVSFMRIWDSMCATLLSTGARRGAMMATLRCDHPDIEEFIEAKQNPHELRHFNVSVLASDAFMEAVEQDADWPLVFPDNHLHEDLAAQHPQLIERQWSGDLQPTLCRVLRVVRARELWHKIMRATYDYAEPGVLFIDRINQINNLAYREHISATNPCGEIPLPPYGACNLGSINLTQFIEHPFSKQARLNYERIQDTVRIATRMQDSVIDCSRFPLPAQQHQAQGTRRIGLGITGLADTLILLGLHYDSTAARELAAAVMKTLCHTAYRTSIELAKEKDPFPFFSEDQYLQSPFIKALPGDIREGIAKHGIRNSHLTTIAPTGTISLLANNISSGLEPVFDFNYRRKVLELDGSYSEYTLTDYALRYWRDCFGDRPLSDAFVDARRIAPGDHLKMQAAIQPYVDNSISKTINVPEDFNFDDFQSLYTQAYALGLKGCTTFRENPVTGAILTSREAGQHHCCDIEREAD